MLLDAFSMFLLNLLEGFWALVRVKGSLDKKRNFPHFPTLENVQTEKK